jgi:hypothetical protein
MNGAFVYRLGRGLLKAERGVRFPYALPIPDNGAYGEVAILAIELKRNHLVTIRGLNPTCSMSKSQS